MTNVWEVKALGVKTSMIFKLVFAIKTILTCFFSVYFLITLVITQISKPISELLIIIGIPTRKANTGNRNMSGDNRN